MTCYISAIKAFYFLDKFSQGIRGFLLSIVQFYKLINISIPYSFASLRSLLVVPIKKLPLLVFWNLASKWKSWIWKDIDIKLSELKVLRGRAYYLKDCIYLLIGLENNPKVLRPGKRVRREIMKELADELECANITTLFWYKTAFQIS